MTSNRNIRLPQKTKPDKTGWVQKRGTQTGAEETWPQFALIYFTQFIFVAVTVSCGFFVPARRKIAADRVVVRSPFPDAPPRDVCSPPPCDGRRPSSLQRHCRCLCFSPQPHCRRRAAPAAPSWLAHRRRPPRSRWCIHRLDQHAQRGGRGRGSREPRQRGCRRRSCLRLCLGAAAISLCSAVQRSRTCRSQHTEDESHESAARRRRGCETMRRRRCSGGAAIDCGGLTRGAGPCCSCVRAVFRSDIARRRSSGGSCVEAQPAQCHQFDARGD